MNPTDPDQSSGKIWKYFLNFNLDIHSLEHVHYMTANKLDRATQNYGITFTVELLGFSFEGGGGTLLWNSFTLDSNLSWRHNYYHHSPTTLFLGIHAYLNSTTDSFLLNNNDPYIMVWQSLVCTVTDPDQSSGKLWKCFAKLWCEHPKLGTWTYLCKNCKF